MASLLNAIDPKTRSEKSVMCQNIETVPERRAADGIDRARQCN